MLTLGILRIFALEHLILFFLYMGFAIFVLSRNYKNPLHRRFFLFLVLVSLVSFFEFLLRQSRDYREASFWLKWLFIWPFVFASLVDLLVVFSGFAGRPGVRVFVGLIYVFSLIVSLVYLFSKFLFKGPVLFSWGWEIGVRNEIIVIVIYLLFLLFFVISTVLFYRGYHRVHGEEGKKRFFYVALGILFPILIELIYLIIYHALGSIGYKILTEPFLISLVVIGLAIKREEMFNISPERNIGEIVSTLNLILIMVDIHGRIRWANNKVCDFLGYERDELHHLKLSDILPAERRQNLVLFSDPFVMKEVSNREVLFETREGKELPVLLNSLSIKDKAGNIVGYVISASDISGQKHLESRYRLEEVKFRTLFEFSPDATVITDREGNILEVNNAVERIFELPRENFIGESVFKLPFFEKSRAEEIREIMGRNRKGEIVGPKEFAVELASGKRLYLEVSTRPFSIGSDRLVIVIIRDVTDKKARELGLIDAFSRLSAYKEAIDRFAIFVEGDSMGFVREVNDKFCSVFGFSREEIVNHHMKELASGDVAESVYNGLRTSLKRNKWWNGIMKFTRKDGSPIYLEVFAQPFFRDGEFFEFWFFGFDVTELKELVEKTKRLESAKTVFLASMSHELRTPLNGVLGFIELLSSTELTAEQAEYIENIKNSAQSLLEIISDILDFSKIERGKLELEYVEFNLLNMAKSVMDIFVPRAEKKRIDLLMYVDPRINSTVMGDPLRIKQVLINFISNAIKFTDSGGCILFEIVLKEDKRDYYELTFSVADTGIGIPRDKIELLFNEFYQVDGTLSKGYGGTGLGLSISNNLVRMMGSEIKVESEYGKGSRFYFDIVLKKRSGLKRKLEDYRLENLSVAFFYSIKELSFSNLIRYFSFMGCRVETFTDIDELVADWERSGSYDLVVLGCKAEDSEDVIRTRLIKIKNLPAVIVCSRNQIRTLGDDVLGTRHAVVFKPFLFERLYRAVGGVISGRVDLGKESLHGARVKEKRKRMSYGGKRVLVAEDNEINQRLMYEILRKYDLEVSVVADGREAVEAFRRTSYDMVFMDVSMPILDGVSATAFIRDVDRGRGKHTPIVALTAHAVRGDREKYLESGMDDYVTKPISIDSIERVLRRYLGESAAVEREGRKPSPKEESRVIGIVERTAKTLGLDYEFVRALISKFIRNSMGIVNSLRERAEARDTGGVEKMAHMLKGAAGNLGLEDIARKAETIELAARAGEEIDYSGEIDKLCELIKIVKEEMNE